MIAAPAAEDRRVEGAVTKRSIGRSPSVASNSPIGCASIASSGQVLFEAISIPRVTDWPTPGATPCQATKLRPASPA